MKYYIKDHGETSEDALEVPKVGKEHPSFFAVLAAEHYHSARSGGWECSWPIVFTVIDDEMIERDFSVERKSVPHFYAVEVKPVSV